MTCIFCEIANHNIPADIWIETDHVLAFKDVTPQAPVHGLVIPKQHISSLMEIDQGDSIMLELIDAIQQVAEMQNIAQSGFRVVNNIGSDGGQEVLHLHFHVLGGRKLGWPPG